MLFSTITAIIIGLSSIQVVTQKSRPSACFSSRATLPA